jgi:hypothetical protein
VSPQEQLLSELADIEAQLYPLTSRKAEIMAQLQAQVEVGEVVLDPGSGLMARWKVGRNATDYQAAAIAYGVPDEEIAAHTQVKETVAWAKVAKTAKIPKNFLAEYTTQGPPSFVVEFPEA